MAAAAKDDVTMDIEAFLRAAKYTLVKFTDMNNEMKEEAMDICVTAVEKYPVDIEKCTQVWPPVRAREKWAWARNSRQHPTWFLLLPCR